MNDNETGTGSTEIEFKRHPEFATHKLNEDGFGKAIEINTAFNVLMNKLETLCMPGRELAISKTKLEEACFFAKKSMAVNLINQSV